MLILFNIFFQCYPLSSNPRGHVYIIDNEEFVNNIFPRRWGSHVDSTNLKILFEGLGFKANNNLLSNVLKFRVLTLWRVAIFQKKSLNFEILVEIGHFKVQTSYKIFKFSSKCWDLENCENWMVERS